MRSDKPRELGLDSSVAAPAPSDSIQRRNSESKETRPSSLDARVSSNKSRRKKRLANSLAQTSALRRPPRRMLWAAYLSAVTPLAQTPLRLAISQGCACNRPCVMLANPGASRSLCDVAAASISISARVNSDLDTASLAASAARSQFQ